MAEVARDVDLRRRRGGNAVLRRSCIRRGLAVAWAAAALVAAACSAPGGRDAGGAAGADTVARGVVLVGAADSARVARRIGDMLTRSTAAWNAGDLEGFLDDYTGEPDLTFVSGSGVMRGLEEVRERYMRTYWSPGSERDSLRFEEVRVRPLGAAHALAHGRYVLHRPRADGDRVTGTGRFSLVLRKETRGWRILHDHSSAAPQDGEG